MLRHWHPFQTGLLSPFLSPSLSPSLSLSSFSLYPFHTSLSLPIFLASVKVDIDVQVSEVETVTLFGQLFSCFSCLPPLPFLPALHTPQQESENLENVLNLLSFLSFRCSIVPALSIAYDNDWDYENRISRDSFIHSLSEFNQLYHR